MCEKIPLIQTVWSKYKANNICLCHRLDLNWEISRNKFKGFYFESKYIIEIHTLAVTEQLNTLIVIPVQGVPRKSDLGSDSP